MSEKIELVVDGKRHTLDADRETPLLYVLTDDLALTGPRFGCGRAQCGACSVLIDGAEVRSCVTPVSAAVGRNITTIHGLPSWHAAKTGRADASKLHPVQEALIAEQAPQCGYCYNGMVVKAAELLAKNPDPDEAEIRSWMNGHLCRCGTYPRIVAAVRRAARAMKG